MAKLLYISSGAYETGGYQYEKFLAETLANSKGYSYSELRFRRQFKGVFQWMLLFIKTFFSAKADVIVTVSRMAWPVYIRNIFTKTKIILILHNHDESDGKPSLFYRSLNSFLGKVPQRLEDRFRLVCISDYWNAFFKSKISNAKQIITFPNLFEIEKLIIFRGVAKKSPGLIHLGQWSDKIDRKAYHLLVHELKKRGLAYYFSSNQKVIDTDFPISYFETQEAFQKQMCMAHVTVVMNKVNEGWPRLVHESMLLGTPVITTNIGGVKPLVALGNGYCVTSIEEILAIIEGELKPVNFKALEEFSYKNAKQYLGSLNLFLNGS